MPLGPRHGVARDMEQRTAAALALAPVVDGRTVALMIEALELHARTLDRLDRRMDVGDDAERLDASAVFLREVNGVRPMLKP